MHGNLSLACQCEEWLALSVARSLSSAWQGGGLGCRSNATVRSCKTRGSVCAMSRGFGPHMTVASQNTSVNIGQRRSHSKSFMVDLVHSLARSGDARHDDKTTQTSLWRGSARTPTFGPTDPRSGHNVNIASDGFPSAKFIAVNGQTGHGAFVEQTCLFSTQLPQDPNPAIALV